MGAEVAPVTVLMLVGEAVLLGAYTTAWSLARSHRGKHHHFVMLTAFFVDLIVFKPLMVARSLDVYGHYPWPGTSISLHLYLDIAATVLGVTAMTLGFKFRVKKGGKMFMPPKGRTHRIIGYAFLGLWATTFVMGIRIFAWAHFG